MRNSEREPLGIYYQNGATIVSRISHECLDEMQQIDPAITIVWLTRYLMITIDQRALFELHATYQCLFSGSGTNILQAPFIFRLRLQIIIQNRHYTRMA